MRIVRSLLLFAAGTGLGAALMVVFQPGRTPDEQMSPSDPSASEPEVAGQAEHGGAELRELAGLLGMNNEADASPAALLRHVRQLQLRLLASTDLPSDTPIPQLCDHIARRCEELAEELKKARQAVVAATTAPVEGPEDSGLVSYVEELNRERLEQQELLTEQLERKDREIARLADRLQSLASRLRTEQENRRQIEVEMLREVDRLRTALESLRRYVPPPFEIQRHEPDGKIVRANNAKRIAWINLGSRDGLRPGLTFSVWSPLSSLPVDRPKAKLMVTRVLDRGLSEARILECDPRHPVVAGDLIGSVAWSPGTRTAFVLAGELDLDGDGADDRDIVRSAIERQGGTVVAELLPDGVVRGTVTSNVRYFVRGKVVASHAKEAMDRLEQEARDYGAYVINLDKLADYLGISLTALRYGRE